MFYTIHKITEDYPLHDNWNKGPIYLWNKEVHETRNQTKWKWNIYLEKISIFLFGQLLV